MLQTAKERRFRNREMERTLDAELLFHFDSQVEHYIRRGLPEVGARRKVRLECGGLEQVKEECRIIALAVGAVTAVFSVVDRSLFRPLPYRFGDRPVSVGAVAPVIVDGVAHTRDDRVAGSGYEADIAGLPQCDRGHRTSFHKRIVSMSRVRMDKWLWAARFFKTRALAARACELGRIECNGLTAKASREVHVGDKLQVRTPGGDFQVEVLGLSEMRGPAAVAQTLYQESDASREQRLRVAAERKAMSAVDALWEGRPSKRDRREMDRLRGRI